MQLIGGCYEPAVANGARGAKVESLEAELAASRIEAASLRAENAELREVLAEVQRALDAADADLGRYRDLYEKSRPNCPERVPSEEQRLVFESLLDSLGATAAPAVNDVGPGAGDPTLPAGAPPLAPPSGEPAPPRRARPHGRRPLNLTDLPVHTVVLDPPEVTAVSGVGWTLVGVEASDRLVFSPARYTRLHLLRRTFRKDVVATEPPASGPAMATPCSSVDDGVESPAATLVTAPIPDAVWPGMLADPSAIAHTIVSKYDDLLPLHRQERITRREGFTVPRSTSCGWLGPAANVLIRIVDAMFADGKATAFCMATDATGAPVRVKYAECESWSVFVFVADQDHVVFRYSRTHDSSALKAMLDGYRGFLLGDATSIYSPLVTLGMIVLVCCWAHVRRYFFKSRESEPRRSNEAIAIIGKLFEVERGCADLVGAERTARRAQLAAPLLKLFDDWLDRERPHVDSRSPLQKAITYADNQREELRRFLGDGRLRLDNNICEGLLRSLVLGLNNWQRFETETGLRWYTTFRSLIASCKLHDLCPQRYLECVLRLAPHWSQRRMVELSPKYWRATAARLSPEQRSIVRPPWSSAFDVFDTSEDTPTASASGPQNAPPTDSAHRSSDPAA